MNQTAMERISEAQLFFGLRQEASVEKDLEVTKAISALATMDGTPFQLIFGGGTAVARAHRLTERMSEDVDFKIILPPGHLGMGRDKLRKELSALRHKAATALAEAGFVFDETNRDHVRSGDENRYILFQLPYLSEFDRDAVLRPHIKIELAWNPILRPPVERSVSSFVAQAFQESPEVSMVLTIDPTETAAEKLVALTRRSAKEAAGLEGVDRDVSLVRHIYDLHKMLPQLDIREVGNLAREVMDLDAKKYGNQFEAYRTDPVIQSRAGMQALAENPDYAQRYAQFTQSMVYGEVPSFDIALKSVATLMEAATQGRL